MKSISIRLHAWTISNVYRDPTIDSESLVAYALGGWLLGSGAGLDNLAVAKSVLRVHTLTQRYLTVGTGPRRQQIASRNYVAKKVHDRNCSPKSSSLCNRRYPHRNLVPTIHQVYCV